MPIPLLAAFDSLLEDTLKRVLASTAGSAVDYVHSFDLLKRGRAAYRRYIRDRFGNIQILGMSEPVPLEDIYVNLRLNSQIASKSYVSLPRQHQPGADRDHSFEFFNRSRSMTSIQPHQAIERFDRAIVLGAPGHGKSTLFCYWCLLLSGNLTNAQQTGKPLFPILIILRHIDNKQNDLKTVINEQIERCGFPHHEHFLNRLLEDGKCLLLFDGLDEVQQNRISWLYDQVYRLIDRYPNNKFILSCRTASYISNFDGFYELEIEGLTKEQKYKFIERWFYKNKKKSESLKTVIRCQAHIEELATSPLLLSLICILYNRDLSLPRNRIELYERAVDTMLNDWDAGRNFRRKTNYEQLSNKKKTKLLNFIAYQLFDENLRIFSAKKVEALLGSYITKFGIEAEEAGNILKEMSSHHGIIVSVSAEYLSFSHLTLHEFFCASYVVDARRELTVLRHINNPRWIEVFNIIASLLEDSTPFLNEMLGNLSDFRRLCLAGYCISGYTAVAPQMKQKIFDALIKELDMSSIGISRLYRTHPHSRKLKAGVFFSLKPEVKKYFKNYVSVEENSKKEEVKRVLRFLASINCIASYFNAVTVDELNDELRRLSGSIAANKILEHILWCKADDYPLIIYSDVLREGGIEMPMETTRFEDRLLYFFKARGGKPR